MTTADIVGIIIAVVLVAAFAAGRAPDHGRRRALRERFGPIRNVVARPAAAGADRAAPAYAAHKQLTLALPEAERERSGQWTAAQAASSTTAAAVSRR